MDSLARAVEVEVVPLDSVTRDPNNTREHGKRSIEGIAKSLKRFGQQKPIVVDRENRIIAGNGTHEALESLGETEVLIARTSLEELEALGYGIADNRTTELSRWDNEELSIAMKRLDLGGVNLDELGWAPDEAHPFLTAKFEKPATREVSFAVDDDHVAVKFTKQQHAALVHKWEQSERNEVETLAEFIYNRAVSC